MAIEFRHGHGLRTGHAASSVSGSDTSADAVDYDRSAASRVLELGARLMREARSDYYTQHLLQQLNDALTTRFNRPQTQVYGLGRWRDSLRRASVSLRALPSNRRQMLYLAVGGAIGALITLGLLIFL